MTEVGAVLVGGGELHETFDSLVQVERPLSRGIQRFTGITQGMVDGAPPPEEVLARAGRPARGPRAWWPTTRASTCGVLRQAFERAGLDWPTPPALCTVQLARRFAPAGAQARARAARRLARDRRRRGAPRAARRPHVRARVLRPVPEAVRERRDGRRRDRPAALAPPGAQDRARRGDPARPAAGPLDAAGRPGRLRLPRRARAAAVRGQVGVAALARAGALLRARGMDRARRDRRLPADQLGARRARAREPADQAVEADRQREAEAHRPLLLPALPARHPLPRARGGERAGARARRERGAARKPGARRRARRPAHLALPAAPLRAQAEGARAPVGVRADGPLRVALPGRPRPERLPPPARRGARPLRGARARASG